MTHLFPTERDDDDSFSHDWDEALEQMELRFTLENNPNLIQPLVAYLCERAVAFGLCEETLEKHIGIALHEALLNALYHGNLELSSADLRQAGDELMARGSAPSIAARQRSAPYCHRQIYVRAMLSSDVAEFVIRDEGPGFRLCRLHAAGDRRWRVGPANGARIAADVLVHGRGTLQFRGERSNDADSARGGLRNRTVDNGSI